MFVVCKRAVQTACQHISCVAHDRVVMDAQTEVLRMLAVLCSVQKSGSRFSSSFQNLNVGAGVKRSCRGHAP